MYVCMYVRRYVCLYVCVYVRLHVCMYVCLPDDEGAAGGGGVGTALMIFFFFFGLGKPVILRFRFLLEVLEATEAVSNAELHSELESSLGMGMSKAFDRLFFAAATLFFLLSVECV